MRYIEGENRSQSTLLPERLDDYIADVDGQISLADRDGRCIATSGKGIAIVGYNVQMAIDLKHHLIVAHEVTNLGHDGTQ